MEVEGLDVRLCDGVYPPSEDTYLLIDALKGLPSLGAGPALDLGTGTGVVGAYLASRGLYVVASDVDPRAARCAWMNAKLNGLRHMVDVVLCDLASAFKRGAFMLVASNPPYLPVEEPILAWSGGPGGVEVARRIVRELPRVLRPGGVALMVVSSLSRVEEVRGEAARLGLEASPHLSRRVGLFEELTALLLERRHPDQGLPEPPSQ